MPPKEHILGDTIIHLIDCLRPRGLPVHQPPNIKRIVILQFIRKQGSRKTLITYRPDESLDGASAYGGRSAIGSSRIGTAMHHGMTDLHTSRVVVNDQSASLLFQYRNKPLMCNKVFLRAVDTHR